MTGNRLLIHSIFVLSLPIIVAACGLSVMSAVALMIVALQWRWAIALSAIIKPAKVPELELETISASHFVEKVRWSMDRLGVDYTERPVAGTLGVFFTSRTVPQLKIHTGATRSVIDNSPDILRYLWGRYAATAGGKADFLAPSPERLALESRIDRYGVNLQVWVYYHVLPNPELTLQAWGYNDLRLPTWQRQALKILFPILRRLIRLAFNISDKQYAKAKEHIERLLEELDQQLSDGRQSLLSGEQIDYVDISFAAISGLWLQPENFGGGMADGVRIELARAPAAMRNDVENWTTRFPNATRFIEELYQQR